MQQAPELLMKSINFEFLRSKWPELAGLGGFAEAYAHTDPLGSLTKLRSYCEQVVGWLHHELRLPKPFRANLIDLLDNQSFRDIVPDVVMSKLHALRIEGNKAVHTGAGNTTTALRVLQDAYNVGRWLYVTHAKGDAQGIPSFLVPPEGGAEGVERRREKRAILERVVAQEAQMQKLLDELEAARSKALQAEATATELEAALQAGKQSAEALQAVDPLAFNEAETRRYLIDLMLTEAGWKVGPGLTNTSEVLKEVVVPFQPTDSEDGRADYVLLDDNDKPLAVIEAKRTAKKAEDGRTQAKLYADGLQKQHSLKTDERPVIFYTNGFDVWLWNDAEDEPPRKVYGFYSKDSLQYLHRQRSQKQPVSQLAPNPTIAGRMYQIEAVRRVVERFAEKKRKALIVQATGTGKTRVAISLCDTLIRGGWAKRILFLCDRRELRKQGHKAFKEFLPSEPRTYVTAATASDRNQRIYLATYPAMMKCFEAFDIGFFDLIIADESHRSLFRRYKVIFDYFDCYQVGLTATPVNEHTLGPYYRNTFKMFQCDDLNPTFNYEYEEAVSKGYLVPFVVDTHTTQFLRKGIKNAELSEEQRAELEEDGEDPSLFNFDPTEVDKVVFNKDTNRHILRNLMEHGIRVSDGSRIGKSIVFARSHNHAVLLQNLFEEMYPQYGGNFCRVIDNYDPRAEELIDDFKGEGQNPELTVAISVDMLDTGIDIPEVVNLVFAKPVFSYVKFWQMIGRGTRLCENLFGPGNDKKEFQIFDHWGNFDRFDQGYEKADQARQKSLLETVFESRLNFARTALELQNEPGFELAVSLLGKDIAALPEKSIPVRDKWQQLQVVRRDDTLKQFDAATQAVLQHEIAPLMEWVNITGHEEAYRFDRLIARMQVEHLRRSSRFDDLKDELLNLIGSLRINLSQVKVKLPIIDRVKSAAFWESATIADLEDLRTELRGIVQFRRIDGSTSLPPKVIDITEDAALIERKRHVIKLAGLDMVAYRNRVQKVLMDIFENSATLQKIKLGQPVEPQDLEDLCSLVLTQEPGLDLHDLTEYFPQAKGLDQAIRSIIGLDADRVQERFTQFVQAHPNLASHQIKFLDLLQSHIARYGSIDIATLYEPPFTSVHNEGLDGVFDDALAGELLDIIDSFRPMAT